MKINKVIFWTLIVTCLIAVPLIFLSIEDGWRVWGCGNIDYAVTGQFGDYVGGVIGTIISASAFYFLYLTLTEQKKATENQKNATEEQKKSFERERFETRFFEMIKMYKENVQELSYTIKHRVEVKKKDSSGDTEKEDKVEIKAITIGKKFFKILDNDFNILYHELAVMFKDRTKDEIYQKKYLDLIESNALLKERGIDPVLYAKIDIIYSILFLGLSSQDREALKNLFLQRYHENFYSKVIAYAAIKPKEHSKYWSRWKIFDEMESIQKKSLFDAQYGNNHLFLSKPQHNSLLVNLYNTFPLSSTKYEDIAFEKYYGGHQFRLGHYFRHLFLTVKYIDNSGAKYHEKLHNIKLLRAQLSTFEQRIIFYNSISSLGRIWELENLSNSDKEIEFESRLITKYNFIKNIPNNSLLDGDLKISAFYPEVYLETSYSPQKKKEREILESRYN